MFDELQPEPEDVFAQTDASAPQIASPTMSAPAPMPAPAPIAMAQPAPASSPMPSEPKKAFPWKVVVLVVAIVAVIGLAFFLSMKILNSKTPVTPAAPEESIVPEDTSVPAAAETIVIPEATTPTDVVPETTPEATAPAVESTLDSDKDGLTDERETQLGTDPNNADTDGDGLFDKEEVDVYKTNPLNPDTDGDTFKDGDEVKKGYNPNGPGKLLEIPQAK